MFYELRHQDVFSGRSLGVLNQQMEAALPIWKRLGIESVGFWSVLVGPTSPRLTSILAWESLEQRQRLWDAFSQDIEWRQVQESIPENPVRQLTNSILRPIPDSPTARHNNQPGRLAGGIFELRILTVESDTDQQRLAQWFTEQGRPHMEKHGIFLMGVWDTYIGIAPQLTYMLVFENQAHRERAWASYHTDPAYPQIQEALYPKGRPLIHHIESSVMRGTQFSYWR